MMYAAALAGHTDMVYQLLHFQCTPRCMVSARNLSSRRGVTYGGNVLHAAARHIARMPPSVTSSGLSMAVSVCLPFVCVVFFFLCFVV